MKAHLPLCWFCVIAFVAIGATSACTTSVNTAVSPVQSGFTSDVDTIQIVSTQLGGKNVFVPSTIVVIGGKAHTLSLYNTTDIPHGFSISGTNVEAIVPVREEFEVALPPLEGGHVHRIHCHLHAAHRSASLVVLP